MKITDKRKTAMTKFSDIPTGGVFISYNCAFCMKVNGIPNSCKNAVRLDCGEMIECMEDHYYEVVKANLVIGHMGDYE